MNQGMSIDDVIAERGLEARDRETGTVRPVVVRLGRPRPDPAPGGDWACPVQVVGLGDDAVTEAYGVDAMQALQLGMQMIAVRLEHDAPEASLTWLGDADVGFGGPGRAGG